MKNWAYVGLLAAALYGGEAVACTIFTVARDGVVLFAGNEDQTQNASYLVVDKTGKYGVVFIATPMPESPMVMQMGVNEKGLSYDINAIGKERLVHLPGKIQQTEWMLVRLMQEVGTVDEMLARFFTYDWGTSIAYQIHIADRSGDAAVIHPGKDGKLTYTRIDRRKGYLVSTNFNLRDVEVQKWVSSRYQTTDARLKALPAKGGLSPKFAASVLEATHREPNFIDPAKTIYSTVIDLNSLDIHLYYDSRFDRPYVLNVPALLARTSGKTTRPLRDVIATLKAP